MTGHFSIAFHFNLCNFCTGCFAFQFLHFIDIVDVADNGCSVRLKQLRHLWLTTSQMATLFEPFYNLDVIISVGYRVKSQRGVKFRQWANKILKQYLVMDYAASGRSRRGPVHSSMSSSMCNFCTHFFRVQLTFLENIVDTRYRSPCGHPPVSARPQSDI